MKNWRSWVSVLGMLTSTAVLGASVDSESSVRATSFFADNPADESLYGHRADSGQQLFLRQATNFNLGPLQLETNVYNFGSGSSNKVSIISLLFSSSDERNRSSYLERHYHNTEGADGYLSVDRLALHLTFNRFRLSAGRFPLDLSVMTIFRPNDLFSPFRGQTLYRKYKPGVDSAEMEIALGQLTQLSVMGVRGYSSATGLSRIGGADEANRFDYEQSSIIGRFATNLLGFQWVMLGGRHRQYELMGGAIQGEFGDHLGIRMEGHHKESSFLEQASDEFNVGIETRIGDSFVATAEWFSHTFGYAKPEDYMRIGEDKDPPRYYLGREYGALGFTFDLTSLTSFRLLSLANFTDSSFLFVSRLSTSLSEEADFSIGTTNTQGKAPIDGTLRSEYGSYPNVLSVETNIYW